MSIHQGSAYGKSETDSAGQRELLLHALRTAAARTRLTTHVLETITAQLRHKEIGCNQAIEWLRTENVLHLVQYKQVPK